MGERSGSGREDCWRGTGSRRARAVAKTRLDSQEARRVQRRAGAADFNPLGSAEQGQALAVTAVLNREVTHRRSAVADIYAGEAARLQCRARLACLAVHHRSTAIDGERICQRVGAGEDHDLIGAGRHLHGLLDVARIALGTRGVGTTRPGLSEANGCRRCGRHPERDHRGCQRHRHARPCSHPALPSADGPGGYPSGAPAARESPPTEWCPL